MDNFLSSSVFDRKISSGVITVINHVVFCSLLSTFLWNWLYDAKCDLVPLFWPDNRDFSVSVAVFFLSSLATVTSAFALLMVFSWKRTVVFLVRLMHLLQLFFLPLDIFANFLLIVPIRHSFQLVLLCVLVLLFFAIGSLTLFTDRLPSRIQRHFITLHCSFLSVIFLRCLPHDNLWKIFLVDIVWDSFSVLIGPVQKMFEKSHEYGEEMVRFVLFTATNDEHKDGEDNRSASDAFDGVQLGFGDFVLFALLVARAWTDHPLCAAAALIGLFIGISVNFAVSFSYSAKLESYFFVPALPCPMLLGMALHFGVLFAVKVFGGKEMEVIVM